MQQRVHSSYHIFEVSWQWLHCLVTQVLADPNLAPYFEGVDMQAQKRKQVGGGTNSCQNGAMAGAWLIARVLAGGSTATPHMAWKRLLMAA